MKLHLGVLDVLVIIALVFAGILAHNWYNAHPTAKEHAFLTKFIEFGKAPTWKKSVGGGGMGGMSWQKE